MRRYVKPRHGGPEIHKISGSCRLQSVLHVLHCLPVLPRTPIVRGHMKTTVLSLRKFPADLHQRIRIAATAKGLSVKQFVIDMLDKHVPAAAAAKAK